MDRDSERMNKYKEMNEALQSLYTSPESGTRMFAVFQRFELTEEQYKSYAEIIGDCILGFYKIADMPRLFQQKLGVSADESQRMVSQLIEFFSPVVKREEEDARAKKESLQGLAQKLGTPAASAQPAPVIPAPPASSIPSETTEHIENVEPIRTMEGDMDRIHGYGAYRDVYKEEAGQEEDSKSEEGERG